MAAGNCVVIKLAEQTPLTLAMFAELTADILPPGVLNVVTGHGHIVGRALAESPRIAKVAFTGSTETGRTIMGYAAKHLIPQTMELGGKSPNIFMPEPTQSLVYPSVGQKPLRHADNGEREVA